MTTAQPFIPYIVMFVLGSLLFSQQPSVLSIGEINIVIAETLTLVWVALAQNIVVLAGGIDLSVGGIVSLTSVLLATHVPLGGLQLMVGLLLVASLGTTLGCVNGALVALTKIQPFIVTMATWSITSGVALLVLPTPGGRVAQSLMDFGNSEAGPLGIASVLLLATIVFWMLLTRTRFGRMALSIGSRREAARLSGIPINWVLVGVYGTSGLFSSLAGIYVVTQTSSGSPTIGNEFILTSIAATVIGGASLAGGRAPWGGAIAGAFTLTLINSVIFSFGVTGAWQFVADGLTLVGAVLLHKLSRRVAAQ